MAQFCACHGDIQFMNMLAIPGGKRVAFDRANVEQTPVYPRYLRAIISSTVGVSMMD